MTTNYAPVNKGYGERREGTIWFSGNVYFNPRSRRRNVKRPGDRVSVRSRVCAHWRVKSLSAVLAHLSEDIVVCVHVGQNVWWHRLFQLACVHGRSHESKQIMVELLDTQSTKGRGCVEVVSEHRSETGSYYSYSVCELHHT